MSVHVVLSTAAEQGDELGMSVGVQDGIGLLHRLLTWLQEVQVSKSFRCLSHDLLTSSLQVVGLAAYSCAKDASQQCFSFRQ